jgi:predicted transcriptional regulator
LKLKYKQEIADEYGFTPKTLQRKLAAKEKFLPRGYLSPLQQREIYETLGYPPSVDMQAYLELEEIKLGVKNNDKSED